MSFTPAQLMHAAALVLTRMSVTGAEALAIESAVSKSYGEGRGRLEVKYGGRSEPAVFEYAEGEDGAVTYRCMANGYTVTLTPAEPIYSQEAV